MNPCPCGYRSDPRRACSCTPPQVEKYLSKISGPLLDRIDLHVEVPAVPFTQLAEMPPGPTSADLRAQVLEARARQAKRFGPRGPQVNGRMTARQVRKYCMLKPEAMALSRPPWKTWACRPAPTTRCCGWRGRSPTSKGTTTSSRRISPRRWGIGRSIGACGRDGDVSARLAANLFPTPTPIEYTFSMRNSSDVRVLERLLEPVTASLNEEAARKLVGLRRQP